MREDERGNGERNVLLKSLLEFPVILLISFVLVFGFVRPVIAAPFYVGSESMEPTLHGCQGCTNDYLLINELAYDLGRPERGDIVLLQDPQGGEEPLIKRVVGLPGDTLKIRGGKLFMNGEPQREPYVINKPCLRGAPRTCSFGAITVPKGHVFVMGDNRAHSYDSRFFGPVPEGDLIGEALFRFWPPGRIGAPR
jgi:signal peptidase I